MDIEKLRVFLLAASTKGYADATEPFVKGADHSYKTEFEKGDLRLHDNWFGGEPFGGRAVVYYKQKPYWMIVYYGSDSGKAAGLIPFLQQALKQPPEELPVRGPKQLADGDFRYENSWEGDLDDFHGEEKIYYKDNEVYKAGYLGGLVDQREDQL